MKRHRVVFRNVARQDLLSIYKYVLSQSGNDTTAKRYLKRIRDRCAKIGDAPFGGIARDDLGSGIRMAVFESSVVILYVIKDDAVQITNVFSGGRDYETLFRRQ